MTLQLQPTITTAGLDAVIDAKGAGLTGKIKHIAFGASPYSPNAGATGLRQERERVEINFSMKTGPGRFRVRGVTPVLPDGVQEYWVHEVGVFLDDGTLLAVWADPSRPITGRGRGAELEFDFELVLDTLPDGSIEIIVTPGGDRVLSALSSFAARAIGAERRSLDDFLAGQAMAREVADPQDAAVQSEGERAFMRDRLADTDRRAAEDRLAAQTLGATLSAEIIRINRITLPPAAA